MIYGVAWQMGQNIAAAHARLRYKILEWWNIRRAVTLYINALLPSMRANNLLVPVRWGRLPSELGLNSQWLLVHQQQSRLLSRSTISQPSYRCLSSASKTRIELVPRYNSITRHPQAKVTSSYIDQCRSLVSTASPPSLDQHNQTVADIAAAVKHFHSRGEKFRINHGSTNSTRNKDKRNLVDTSSLSHVLHVDTVRKTCLVEPNVPMDRLVEATLKHGLVPPVVMEFPGITVGGGYSGTSGESSSFRHGFFDRTVNWVEMVLADGEVVRLSESERGDLFRGAAGAVGTFGVTTLVELRLQDAKRFVETEYRPVKSMKEAIRVLNEATADETVDYVDGIMYSLDQGAIVVGRLTDTPREDVRTQRFSGPWDPWFYSHVQDAITKRPDAATREAVPLAEYFFRYDRGGFWVGASAFKYFSFPFNKLTRWWLDDFLHTRMMYTALHASGESKRYVVQDLALPYATAEEFVNYTAKEFNIWPLWLCPLKPSPGPTMHPHSLLPAPSGKENTKDKELLLNIGLWGFGPQNPAEFVVKNKALEQKLTQLGGMKWLYAHTYYDSPTFWKMFDQKWYEQLREKYRAKGLPNVWEKVWVDVEGEKKREAQRGWWERVRKVWPLGGFYGIRKAIQSKSYIASRASTWKEFGREEK